MAHAGPVRLVRHPYARFARADRLYARVLGAALVLAKDAHTATAELVVTLTGAHVALAAPSKRVPGAGVAVTLSEAVPGAERDMLLVLCVPVPPPPPLTHAAARMMRRTRGTRHSPQLASLLVRRVSRCGLQAWARTRNAALAVAQRPAVRLPGQEEPGWDWLEATLLGVGRDTRSAHLVRTRARALGCAAQSPSRRRDCRQRRVRLSRAW